MKDKTVTFLKNLFLVPSILFVALLFISIIESCSKSQNNPVLADGFTIENYTVNLNVQLDNVVEVTENITIYFTNAYKHGIYKYTPKWLEYTSKDNKTIKRKSQIKNLQAVNDPYTIDEVNGKARIKIGDANQYLGLGYKTYTIKYTYDMGKDPFKNFDEFIFHTIGDYWGTEIKNATITVTMPKSIEGYPINFFTDKYREKNVTKYVDYTVNQNTLTAHFNNITSPKPLNSSLTVDIELPENYFVGGSYNYGYISIFIFIIILLITLYTIIRWLKVGKDHQKRVETIEFYPPDNLSSAQIGYVYNNKQNSKKQTISLLISLASKGYIKINEENSKIIITNLIIKPIAPLPFNDALEERTIEVKKEKEIDDSLTKEEKTMMIYLFSNGNIKKINANIDEFLIVKDSLITKGYITILNDNVEFLESNLQKRREEYNKQKEKYQQDLEKYYTTLKKFPPLNKLEEIVYNRLFSRGDIVTLEEHPTFYKAFEDVKKELDTSFKDQIYDSKSHKEFKSSIIRTVVILVLSIVSYFLIADVSPNVAFLYPVSFACIPINFFFTLFMKRKTTYGEEISARVKGFRNFLITAEKEQLESLVNQNPSYFYNILPYTYVLNISKKWIKKFENIPVPSVDMGNFDFYNDASYTDLYSSIIYPTPTYSSSSRSSSGCSSCGGGCSSCGGGCSSCGGGGSW